MTVLYLDGTNACGGPGSAGEAFEVQLMITTPGFGVGAGRMGSDPRRRVRAGGQLATGQCADEPVTGADG